MAGLVLDTDAIQLCIGHVRELRDRDNWERHVRVDRTWQQDRRDGSNGNARSGICPGGHRHS